MRPPKSAAATDVVLQELRPWTEFYRVRSYEADANGRATPASLCNYLQEAAGNHASALGLSVEQLRLSGLTWMLSRLRLEAAQLPHWRDTISVETWPSGNQGLLAMREFIVRSDSGEAIARATTAWLLIDLDRRRPARLPEEVLALRLPDRRPALTFTGDRVPAPEDPHAEEPVIVRWTDMDVNEHVNNVRYVAWALDALPEDILRSCMLSALSVDFLSESHMGDRLRVRRGAGAGGEEQRFLCEISRESDGSEVARIASAWRGLT